MTKAAPEWVEEDGLLRWKASNDVAAWEIESNSDGTEDLFVVVRCADKAQAMRLAYTLYVRAKEEGLL
jgi:hypothetical protein